MNALNAFAHTAIGGCAAIVACIALTTDSPAQTAPDKYSLKVPGGLSFAEFRGYENWETISMSQNDRLMAVILGNAAMINAYKNGFPGNGKPIPDGAKMAKIHWTPTRNVKAPGQPTVPGELHDVDFMVKDSKRFADSGGWGYAAFKYDSAKKAYLPQTTADTPPQANDAKCGFACHTVVQSRDYVFTDYARR